jgi:predicted amidohydrolase
MNSRKNNILAGLFICLIFCTVSYGLNITCVSMAASDNADNNLQTIKSLIAQAPGELVVFPELALCNINSGKDQTFVDGAINELKTICASAKKSVVFGSVRWVNNMAFNAAYFINSSGVQAGVYDQIHPQNPAYTPAVKIPFFPLATSEGLVKFGIQIGHDLFVPEPWQFFAEVGVRCQLLVYLTALNGSDAWKKEVNDDVLMARAADNTCFAASASSAGSTSLVSSQVLNGVGEVIGSHDASAQGMMSAQISFASPGFHIFKRHDEWRRDLYEIVFKNPPLERTEPVLKKADNLLRVFPNPFNTRVTIRVNRGQRTEDRGQHIQLNIYDLKGQLVHFLASDLWLLTSGISWNLSGLPAGIYLLKADLGGKSRTHKLFLQ